MPSSLTPFAFGENLVRTSIDENGNPWFVAKDVCRVLEIEKYRDAVARLDEDERGSVLVDTLGGPQDMATISESGLYALVFRSRKAQARAFSKWVRSEVLPALRKTGSYSLPGERPALRGRSPFDMAALPPDVLTMNRNLRQRCLSYTLQMARLTGLGDVDELRESFVACCRMFAARPREVCETPDNLLRFLEETCERGVEFCTGTQKLWLAFRLWAPEKLGISAKDIISLKSFAIRIREVSGARIIRERPSLLLEGLRLNEKWRKRISSQE